MPHTLRAAWILVLTSACAGPGPSGTPTGTATATGTGTGTGAATGTGTGAGTGTGTGAGTGAGTGVGTGTGTGTGTGGTTPPGTCPSVHDPIAERACVSTTAVVTTGPGTYAESWEAWVDATVVAAAPGPVNVPGAPSLDPCDGTVVPAAQTVELLDENGETWVLGWEIEGPDNVAAALASLSPGQPVNLAVRYAFWGYGGGWGVALHDAAGPLVVIDRSTLDPAARGFDVVVRGNVCQSVDSWGAPWDEDELTFSTPIDDLVLFTGQRGTLEHPGRTLDVAVDQTGWPQGCADGCAYNGFAVWAAP